MTKEFIPYQEALELKSIGFDEPTSFYWEDNAIKPLPMKDEVVAFHFNRHARTENEWICAPLYQQSFSWFIKHPDWPIDSWIEPHLSQNPKQYEGFYWRRGKILSVGVFSTYDEAQLNLLRKLIEIVKTKQ